MLQVARLAPRCLGESAERVAGFLREQLTPEGAFRDRSGGPDLYYTVFGLEAMLALRLDLPAAAVREYLLGLGEGEGLDFVHLACLLRAWACLPPPLRAGAPGAAVLRRIEGHRTPDGGYGDEPGEPEGTLYGCFLALGAYQDAGGDVPDPEGLVRCIEGLRSADGGYANVRGADLGLTPSASAAAALLRQLGRPAPPELGPWLLERCHPEGGFYATPLAPMPDLLSTATALHALSGLHADIDPIREACLDFIDTLWTARGAFYGTWADEEVDVEYTYYGLLALGHLAV